MSDIEREEMLHDTFAYKVVGDCRLQLDVYRPSDGAVRPAVVWLHGGALIVGSRADIDPRQRDLYLKAGYAVIAPDYRLAPESKLADIVDDLRDAFAWTRAEAARQVGIDPSRLAAVGHSAGGYLALMAGFAVRPRPRAVVAFYGYGDIVGDWYRLPDPYYCRQPLVSRAEALSTVGEQPISGADARQSESRSRFYLYCRQQGRWPREVAGRDPDVEPEAFDPFCPARNVTGDYPPTMLLHGDRDTDVPYEQSALMAGRLAAAGAAADLVTVPGGGHGFDDNLAEPEIAAVFGRALDFLDRHLGQTSQLP